MDHERGYQCRLSSAIPLWLFSIADIETVDGIDLMTGGYTAAFGNRLTGVLIQWQQAKAKAHFRNQI